MYSVVYFVAFIFGMLCNTFAESDIIVSTAYGDIKGLQTDTTQYFLGIPYAQPPVGANRWLSPLDPSPWKPNIYDATTFKPGCPQKYCSKYLPHISCPSETSEDCLYLNIWAPRNATSTSGYGYPVMVFIHGGSFRWGSGSTYVYNGDHLAQKGEVVVVNMDYRLGLLGFLYTGDEPDDAHGNFGIQDQRLALQWVQQNIRNFGGDPKRVVLFGQSAGAQSTFLHLMSIRSEGLFRGAIVESSPFAVPYRYKSEALLLALKAKKYLKCKTMDCLRNKTVEEIGDTQDAISLKITAGKLNEYYEPTGPVIDGIDISSQPMYAAAKGLFLKVPIMTGTVTEEGRSFVYGAWKKNLTKAEFDTAIAVAHPEHDKDIQHLYSSKDDLIDYRDNMSSVVSDFLFTCATRNTTMNLVSNNEADVYRYVFDHATDSGVEWGRDKYCDGHVCHSAELIYVFGNYVNGTATTEEKELTESMMTYWSNFAYTLDPNDGKKSPGLIWPAYRLNTTSTMYFKTPNNTLLDDYRVEYCDLWDSFGFQEVEYS